MLALPYRCVCLMITQCMLALPFYSACLPYDIACLPNDFVVHASLIILQCLPYDIACLQCMLAVPYRSDCHMILQCKLAERYYNGCFPYLSKWVTYIFIKQNISYLGNRRRHNCFGCDVGLHWTNCLCSKVRLPNAMSFVTKKPMKTNAGDTSLCGNKKEKNFSVTT